jgi:hypothetical protein
MKGQDAAILEAGDKIWPDVGITPNYERKVDAVINQLLVEERNAVPDVSCVGVIDPRQHMGGAGHNGNAVIDCHTGHINSHGEINGPIVNSRQNMAVKVDHHAVTEPIDPACWITVCP